MAPYQQFKLYLVDLLGLQKEFFHIVIGFFVFIGVYYISKKKLSSFTLLIPPLAFAILLEIFDLRDVLTYGGPYNPWDTMRDILITLVCPLAVVVAVKLKREEIHTSI